MQSWIVTDIEFRTTCPDNMKSYIYFLQGHHRYSHEKLSEYLSEYINLIEYGIIATNYGHVLRKERIN